MEKRKVEKGKEEEGMETRVGKKKRRAEKVG